MNAPGAGGAGAEPREVVNVLIVDDEPKNLTVLESVLDDPGYRLVRATSGQEALLALMAHEFAVLVLDVRMPVMTGFELAQTIKLRKKTARVPIIFLTAYFNEDRHKLEGYGSGAVDYLHKPIDAAVLRSKVAVFAELHRKRRALELANDALRVEVLERRRAEQRLSELNESLDRRVTERTNALLEREAQLRDANRRKDEFLATLAHELRNPLAPIRNAIELLRRKGGGTPDHQWATELIDRQSTLMERLIDDLMDVSRINEGKIELRRRWVDVGPVLDEAIRATAKLIEDSGHQLDLQLPEAPLLVDADPARLTQAFMNLLNNAAKYTQRGGRILVDLRCVGDQVVVSVRDTGIGIAREQLEDIFEMFSQVDTALSRSRGGLGIGLSLTRRLVELHGGRVVARSAGLGQGAEFEISLPHRPAPEMPAIAAKPAEPALAGRAGRQFRILVADDNLDAAATLAALLQSMEHEVRQVHDGAAAIQAAAEFAPQVVILDIGMPLVTGFDACRQIRLLPGGPAMTVVACTGWGQPEDRRKSKEAGFDHHWVKPLNPAVLSQLLETLAAKALPEA